MRTEYQGRSNPHWHNAAWIICPGLLSSLGGRTGTAVVSAFVKFIAALFHCQVDVQIGSGRLNYINGYASKDHDAVDVGLGEYVQSNSTSSWLATYRLMSKSSQASLKWPFAWRNCLSLTARILMYCCTLHSLRPCGFMIIAKGIFQAGCMASAFRR